MGALRLKVGARSSRLSQAQIGIVSGLLRRKFGEGLAIEFVPVRTLGDRQQGQSAKKVGQAGVKGTFTSDIEALLLKGDIDVAVHSMKDLTSESSDGLAIGATPPRSDPRDALITSQGKTLETLRKGAKVGTSSLRRKTQLLRLRHDLDVVELHGNIDTRIRRVAGNERRDLDAIVLAVAGLERIGEDGRITQKFSIEEMIPAVGQGIIAVQMRKGDAEVARVLAQIDDRTARVESECERAFAQHTGADCYLPIGGCARASGEKVRMIGMLAKEDGTRLRRDSVDGLSSEAAALGRRLAESLLDRTDSARGAAS